MQKKLLLIIPILFFLNINELKVISYNIRYNNSNDGINIWENRRSTIKNFIVDENPDFAGLQEVTYSQLIFLTESLKDYDYIGVGRDDGKTKGEFSPIFYNRNKYKVLSNDTFWLSSTPEKFLLVGTLQWKEYVHMDYLKIYIQKISYGYSIPILITLVIMQEKNLQI